MDKDLWKIFAERVSHNRTLFISRAPGLHSGSKDILYTQPGRLRREMLR